MNLSYFFTQKMLFSFLLMVSFIGYSQEVKYYSDKRNLKEETNFSTIFVSDGTIIYGNENILNGKIDTVKKQKNKHNKTLGTKKKTAKPLTEKLVQKKVYPREKSQEAIVNRDAETHCRVAASAGFATTTVVNNHQIGLAVIYQSISKINALQKPILWLYDDAENESVTNSSFSIRPPPFCLA